MDKVIAHFMLSKLLFFLTLVVTLPVWLLAAWLAYNMKPDGEMNVLVKVFVCFFGLAVMALAVGLYWLSKKMSFHMIFGGLSFGKGVKAGLLDARLHLAFLPVVGHWFHYTKKRDDNDDA